MIRHETVFVCLQDAGQKAFGAVTCNVCGMLYSPSSPEDESQHLLFHNQFISAVRYVVRQCHNSFSFLSTIFKYGFHVQMGVCHLVSVPGLEEGENSGRVSRWQNYSRSARWPQIRIKKGACFPPYLCFLFLSRDVFNGFPYSLSACNQRLKRSEKWSTMTWAFSRWRPRSRRRPKPSSSFQTIRKWQAASSPNTFKRSAEPRVYKRLSSRMLACLYGFNVYVCAGLQGDRGGCARGVRRGEGHVRASEGLVLLDRCWTGALWHQSHLGVQHDEEERNRITHDRVPQVECQTLESMLSMSCLESFFKNVLFCNFIFQTEHCKNDFLT